MLFSKRLYRHHQDVEDGDSSVNELATDDVDQGASAGTEKRFFVLHFYFVC